MNDLSNCPACGESSRSPVVVMPVRDTLALRFDCGHAVTGEALRDAFGVTNADVLALLNTTP